MTQGRIFRLVAYCQGLTITEIAKATTFPRSTVNAAFSETQPAGEELVLEICHALHLQPLRVLCFPRRYWSQRRKEWLTRDSQEIDLEVPEPLYPADP